MFGIWSMFGCTAQSFQDNKVYIVERGNTLQEESFLVDWLDIQAENPFIDEKDELILAENQILFTRDKENQAYYYGEYTGKRNENILHGIATPQINIYRKELANGDVKLIAKDIPFVSKVSWNIAGNMLALGGSGTLMVYDCLEEKVLLEEKSADFVTDFFWSTMEENKLYVEQLDNLSGIVYYLPLQKKAEFYETKEDLYYKAKVDENYYYATEWRDGPDEEKDMYTVLAEKNKKIVKDVGKGNYKDHYKRQVLLGENDQYSLIYIADINQVHQRQVLTEEYIYDAKFIAGGKILYVTAAPNAARNRYLAHIVAPSGEEIAVFNISGTAVLLNESGTKGYVSGMMHEILDFSVGEENGESKELVAAKS